MKLKLVKVNKKSQIYENEQYRVKISDIDGVFYGINGKGWSNIPYDYDKNDGDLIKLEGAVTLEIKNKKTGKKAQKRCYQGYDVIYDVQADLDGDKSKFWDMFDKVDN